MSYQEFQRDQMRRHVENGRTWYPLNKIRRRRSDRIIAWTSFIVFVLMLGFVLASAIHELVRGWPR